MELVDFLASEEIRKFISDNLKSDTDRLLFNPPGLIKGNEKAIVEQILARRKFQDKFPEHDHQDWQVLPPPLSIEQSSSRAAADYKAQLVSGDHLVDLTGGLGMDCLAFSKSFKRVTYVEQDPFIASCFNTNSPDSVEVINGSAETFLTEFHGNASFFIDPSRRSPKGKVITLEESSPNVAELLPELKLKAHSVLLKTSPILDLTSTRNVLQDVITTHVIAIKNEVKEVLYLLDFGSSQIHQIKCVDLHSGLEFSFDPHEEQVLAEYSDPQTYLYLPHGAIMKAGGFNTIARRFELKKIAPNTHIYTSENILKNFPGRIFEVLESSTTRKEIKERLPGQAHVITRNYPESTDALKKRLKLKEKGDQYILGFRDLNGKPNLSLARLIDQN